MDNIEIDREEVQRLVVDRIVHEMLGNRKLNNDWKLWPNIREGVINAITANSEFISQMKAEIMAELPGHLDSYIAQHLASREGRKDWKDQLDAAIDRATSHVVQYFETHAENRLRGMTVNMIQEALKPHIDRFIGKLGT